VDLNTHVPPLKTAPSTHETGHDFMDGYGDRKVERERERERDTDRLRGVEQKG